MIDLDHNATSPLAPAALEKMLPWLRAAANASSVHLAGQRARAAIDDARESLATALGCDAAELVFTSGGTEADNLALRAVARPGTRLVTTSVEHAAVRDTARALARQGVELVELPVDGRGALDVDAAARSIGPGTSLVSAMWANNETGVVFPVAQLGLLCRERGVPLHVDAVQAFGKTPIDLATLPIDLLSVSAHKIGGPQGAGALFVRRGRTLEPVLTGGPQERGRRGGTENVAALAGFGVAAELTVSRLEETTSHVATLAARLESRLVATIPDVRVTASGAPKLPHTLHLCLRGVEGEALVMALDLEGIRASSGSACSSGSTEPSHVLTAMGIAPEWSRGALRLSLGPENTMAEVDEVARVLPGLVARLREHARR